jgi:hypothetical protein
MASSGARQASFLTFLQCYVPRPLMPGVRRPNMQYRRGVTGMSDFEPDIKTKYTEGCSALRHYSVCVLNTRIITIVQGFVILTGAIYSIKEGLFWSSLCISVFGLLFTAVLNRLQKNYWLHANAILKKVVELERDGPWTAYSVQRKKRHGQKIWKMLVVEGPFYLLVTALVALYLYDAYKLGLLLYSIIFLFVIAGGYLFLGMKVDEETEAEQETTAANGVRSKI